MWRDFWQGHWGFTRTSVIKSLLNRTFMLWKSYSTVHVSLVFFEEDGCSHNVLYCVWIVHFMLWLNKPLFSSHQTHTNTHNHLLCPCLRPVITVPTSLIYWMASPDPITIQFTSNYRKHSKQRLLETLNKSNRNVQTIQNKYICCSFFKTQET